MVTCLRVMSADLHRKSGRVGRSSGLTVPGGPGSEDAPDVVASAKTRLQRRPEPQVGDLTHHLLRDRWVGVVNQELTESGSEDK